MKSITRFKNNKRGIECTNCKQPISNHDNFCSECGQVNDIQNLSLKQYFTEFFAGVFSFDNRLWKTLIPLIFKPGKVTKEYIYGKRMKYVNPFKLYLHTTIIFFLVAGIISMFNQYNLTEEKDKNQDLLVVNTDSQKDKKTTKKDSVIPLPEISYQNYKEKVTNNLDSILVSKKFIDLVKNTELNEEDKNKKLNAYILRHAYKLYDTIKKVNSIQIDSLNNYSKFKKSYLYHTQQNLNKKKIKFNISEDSKLEGDEKMLFYIVGENNFKKIRHFKKIDDKPVSRVLDSLGYQKTRKNAYLYKKVQEFKKINNGSSKREYYNKYISKISLMLFFMLPFFTLFLKLYYIRHKINYTEHLIFVFNTQTVFFILLLIGLTIDFLFNITHASLISLILFLIYLYIAIKKFYQQKWFKTLIKYLIICFTYFFIGIITGILTFFIVIIA